MTIREAKSWDWGLAIFGGVCAILFAFSITITPRITHAQVPRVLNTYTATCDLTLAGAAKKCTLQQPSSGAKTVQLVDATIYLAQAGDVTFSCNGTAATATAGTIRSNNPTFAATVAVKLWTDSDVGAGTACGPPVPIIAAVPVPLDMSDYQLSGNGTARNITIALPAIVGRGLVSFRFKEY